MVFKMNCTLDFTKQCTGCLNCLDCLGTIDLTVHDTCNVERMDEDLDRGLKIVGCIQGEIREESQ